MALHADLVGLNTEALPHVYLGPAYEEQEMEQALKNANLVYRRSAHIEEDIARELAQDKVVARFDGAMEFGPRALGNRSILADPCERQHLTDGGPFG